MRVISKKIIRDFGEDHAQVKEDLLIWFHQVEAADWADFNALRADFPTCDYIGNDRYVFNIKGNHYRLIAMIFFTTHRIYIRNIYTHAAYSKLTKKAIMNL